MSLNTHYQHPLIAISENTSSPDDLFSALINNHHLGFAELTTDGILIAFNQVFCTWTGLDSDDRSSSIHYCLPGIGKFLKKFQQQRRSTPQFELISFPLKRRGLEEALQFEGIMLKKVDFQGSHRIYLFCWMKQGISTIRTPQQDEALQNLLTSVPIGVISINSDWECEFVNQEFCVLTEHSEHQLLGRGWTSVFEKQNERLHELVSALLQKGAAQSEISVKIPGHKVRSLELDFRAYLDNNGSLSHAVGALVDVTERVERQNHIHRLANYDSVTGLHNRLSMQHQLERYLEVAQKLHQKVQVLFIDLDGFKTINDLYGHPVGDQLLKQVAQRILTQVRNTDIVARIGGDEFVILMPGNINDDVVDSIAKKLIDGIGEKFQIDEILIHVTCSIGVACYHGELDETNCEAQLLMDELLKQADIALYAAKQQGKNIYNRFSESQSDKITSMYQILQRLPEAVNDKRFYMNYQPIVSAATGELISVEALIRWKDDVLGPVRPDLFIDVAEAHGKIIEVQRCMVEQVGKNIHAFDCSLPDNITPLRVAINLSGLQLCDHDYLLSFLDHFRSLGIDSHRITLEITENMLIEDRPEILGQLEELIEMGFKLALDDFGTGYSSLSYLARFPIDYVKLDKSFVNRMEKDDRQGSLVDGVIKLSHSLGKKVIAEGVETRQQLSLLKTMDCDLIQGYLIAKPLSLTDLILWVNQQHGKQNKSTS